MPVPPGLIYYSPGLIKSTWNPILPIREPIYWKGVRILLTCEVSLLPLETVKADEIVNQSLEALKATGVKHEVGNMSTYLYSEDPAQIWNGLKTIYETAEKAGTEFSMVINLSNNT